MSCLLRLVEPAKRLSTWHPQEFVLPASSSAQQLDIPLSTGGEAAGSGGAGGAVVSMGLTDHQAAQSPPDVQALANGAVQLKAQAQNFQARAFTCLLPQLHCPAAVC